MTDTTPADFDPNSYDRVLVGFSGGKDSLACLLHLLERGVDPAKIELHHHDVDGGGSAFMDWPVTASYCRAVAKAFNLPIFFSWKEGGFEREMMRDGTATAPIHFETPEGMSVAGGKGPAGTRLKFPQVSADLSVRWCSAYLKIDVMAAAIRNQDRFLGQKVLVVTGERAQESTARAKYATLEKHRSDTRDGTRRARHVDQWRPVHAWSEAEVWAIIQRNGVVPHPAYRLGWGRLSCMACIFGSANQWATILAIAPVFFERLAEREEALGVTVQRSRSLRVLAGLGLPYAAAISQPALVEVAMGHDYSLPVRCLPEAWEMPAGAFGESAGPT